MFGSLYNSQGNDNGFAASGRTISLGSLWSMDRTEATIFLCLFGAGCVFTMLSFVFFPLIVVAPHKFTLLFTLGSVFLMNSIAYINGYAAFAKHLIEPKKLPFSLAYVLSLVGCLYSTLVSGTYLLTLTTVIIQFISLLVFLISYFPGGTTMLSAAKDAAISTVTGRSNSTVLPF